MENSRDIIFVHRLVYGRDEYWPHPDSPRAQELVAWLRQKTLTYKDMLFLARLGVDLKVRPHEPPSLEA